MLGWGLLRGLSLSSVSLTSLPPTSSKVQYVRLCLTHRSPKGYRHQSALPPHLEGQYGTGHGTPYGLPCAVTYSPRTRTCVYTTVNSSVRWPTLPSPNLDKRHPPLIGCRFRGGPNFAFSFNSATPERIENSLSQSTRPIKGHVRKCALHLR